MGNSSIDVTFIGSAGAAMYTPATARGIDHAEYLNNTKEGMVIEGWCIWA